MTLGDADARPQVAKVFEAFLDCGRAGSAFQRPGLLDFRPHDAHMRAVQLEAGLCAAHARQSAEPVVAGHVDVHHVNPTHLAHLSPQRLDGVDNQRADVFLLDVSLHG
jgi:hypothetical protein